MTGGTVVTDVTVVTDGTVATDVTMETSRTVVTDVTVVTTMMASSFPIRVMVLSMFKKITKCHHRGNLREWSV